MRASDVWIEKLAMFISRRCDLFRWSAVFRRCHVTTSTTISDHRRQIKMFVWSPAFLSEPGSARYSSAPSITTVWSNYQTSYKDFFEVYITETVILSPYIQNGPFDQFNFLNVNQSTSRDQSFFVLIGQIAFSWYSVMIVYVNVQTSVVDPQ